MKPHTIAGLTLVQLAHHLLAVAAQSKASGTPTPDVTVVNRTTGYDLVLSAREV